MVTEVFPNIYIGDQDYWESEGRFLDSHSWSVILAAKEPFHRQAVGYKTHAAPKGPHYLYKIDEHILSLNLIDSNDPEYIPKEIIDLSLQYIHHSTTQGKKVLVCCNKGQSRSPSIVFLYGKNFGILSDNFFDAVHQFEVLYPRFQPSKGLAFFIRDYRYGE